MGSAVGTRAEVQEMLRLAVEEKLKPIIEVVPFEKLEDAARRLDKGEVTGRLVMRLPE